MPETIDNLLKQAQELENQNYIDISYNKEIDSILSQSDIQSKINLIVELDTKINPETIEKPKNELDYYAGKLVCELQISKHPEIPIYHNQYAILLQENNKFEEAKIEFEKAISLSPNTALFYYNYAGLLSTDFYKEYDLAKKYFELAISYNPNDEDYYVGIARLFQNDFYQDYKSATENIENAISLNSRYRKAYLELALLYDTKLNDTKKSKEYYQKYFAIKLSETEKYEQMNKNRLKSVNHITIENYYSIKFIELTNLKSYKEIYFLGENGDGKTILLQAILLAFKGFYLKNYLDKELTSTAQNSIAENKKLTAIVEDNIGLGFGGIFQSFATNIFAYGVGRNRFKGDNEDKYGFMSLFNSDFKLQNPEKWLVDLYVYELAKDYSLIPLENAIALITDILERDIEIRVNHKEAKFIEKGTELRFDQLSEGYRSVMIWVADLVMKLSKNQPNTKKTTDFEGVVLIDEIDLHLHPKWCYSIVNKLRTWFPKIQWFITTHSEDVIRGAGEDAVFYKLYKEYDPEYRQNVVKVSEPYTAEGIADLMSNTISTSPLVGLEHARTRIYEKLNQLSDTSDHYWYKRISKIIDRQMKEQPQKGYFSPEDIDLLIEKAIVELENE